MESKSESVEMSFLVSALSKENRYQTLEEFMNWFNSRKEANRFDVRKIPFNEFDDWKFNESTGDLFHNSGKFFKIRGLRSSTNFGNMGKWEQPIIDQPEVGILGIITKVFGGVRYFLMQAKMEPGNINTIQLSPSVQATKSNYTQVHEGKKPKYIEYFIDKNKSNILIDQLQTEQGGRFFKKINRNMIIEIENEIQIEDDFRWLTLGEIKTLMRKDDFVNMDARSVLSCISFIDGDLENKYILKGKESLFEDKLLSNISDEFEKDLLISMIEKRGVNTIDEIINWFTNIKANNFLKSEEIGLNKVSNWIKTDSEIKHESKKFFSVIGVSVEAGNREVSKWTQPLIKQEYHGFSGFLTKKINGVSHFLIQACLEPGSPFVFELIPSVLCYNIEDKVSNNESPEYYEYFKNASEKEIKYSCFQSDEGGRFFKSHNKCMIVELDDEIEVKKNYMWVTLGQLSELSRHNYLSIDTRGLVACINFLEDEMTLDFEKDKKVDHPRGWDYDELKRMDVKLWSYLEEYDKEKDEIHGAIESVLKSGTLILGNNVRKFEEDFSRYCDTDFGIGVGNCTDALFLGLKALNIGDGDEVICVANTAVPTISAIAATGARTRFVDINPDTYLMDVNKIEDVINEKTKCILPVHLYGQCVDMDKVKEIADRRGLKILEDCAQAHGATYKGRKSGSMSNLSAFSFYPSKVLGAYGDAGIVVTKSKELNERVKSLRMYGMKGSYFSVETGYNSRLDELHAAILLKKLSHIEEYISKRQRIAKRYKELLSDLENNGLVLPKIAEGNTHVYYVYVCRHPKRDVIIEELKKRGIVVNVSYEWPVHTMEGYKNLGYKEGDLPHSEKACREIFSLPMYPELSDDKIQKVSDSLHEIFADLD